MLRLRGCVKRLIPKYFIIDLIQFYRFYILPLFPAHCRFYPTCSFFAIGAIEKHGMYWGLWLTIKRLLRCHPLSKSTGHDPIL